MVYYNTKLKVQNSSHMMEKITEVSNIKTNPYVRPISNEVIAIVIVIVNTGRRSLQPSIFRSKRNMVTAKVRVYIL